MIWESFPDYTALSVRAADIFLAAIRAAPSIVLGLPTGRTPLGMYERVVARCAAEYHCFRDVVTFNLDEYAGIPPEHPGSYCTFMKRNLFDHVGVDPKNTHIPDGAAADLDAECARYERDIAAAGGLGLTFLGLGSNGHIAFNEPGTPWSSRTRVVELTPLHPRGERTALPRRQRPRARDHDGHRNDSRVPPHRAPRERREETRGDRAAAKRRAERGVSGERAVDA